MQTVERRLAELPLRTGKRVGGEIVQAAGDRRLPLLAVTSTAPSA